MSETEPEGPNEITDEDFAKLDSFLPGEAGRIIRRVMRKARTLTETAATLTSAVQQLNTARTNHKDRLDDLERRVRALEPTVPPKV